MLSLRSVSFTEGVVLQCLQWECGLTMCTVGVWSYSVYSGSVVSQWECGQQWECGLTVCSGSVVLQWECGLTVCTVRESVAYKRVP